MSASSPHDGNRAVEVSGGLPSVPGNKRQAGVSPRGGNCDAETVRGLELRIQNLRLDRTEEGINEQEEKSKGLSQTEMTRLSAVLGTIYCAVVYARISLVTNDPGALLMVIGHVEIFMKCLLKARLT